MTYKEYTTEQKDLYSRLCALRYEGFETEETYEQLIRLNEEYKRLTESKIVI